MFERSLGSSVNNGLEKSRDLGNWSFCFCCTGAEKDLFNKSASNGGRWE